MISKLHHASYRCRDTEETRAFYEDFLGLPMVAGIEIGELAPDEPQRAFHSFFRLADGSFLSFFEVPEAAFDFSPREELDLHLALEVDAELLDLAKRAAEDRGMEARIADHIICRSLYLRDPNGYVVELAAKSAMHDALLDPAFNQARERLVRWQAAKPAAAGAM